MPSIVGFLIAGVFLGPHGFGFIQDVHEVELVAEVGVILLLFAIGLEISLKNLKRTRSAPNPEFIFKPGDVVYLIGKREKVCKTIELLDARPEEERVNQIRLAPADAFVRVGMNRTRFSFLKRACRRLYDDEVRQFSSLTQNPDSDAKGFDSVQGGVASGGGGGGG